MVSVGWPPAGKAGRRAVISPVIIRSGASLPRYPIRSSTSAPGSNSVSSEYLNPRPAASQLLMTTSKLSISAILSL
jgi:hypothetical protein